MDKNFDDFIRYLESNEEYRKTIFDEDIEDGATADFFNAVLTGINERPLTILRLYHEWINK